MKDNLTIVKVGGKIIDDESIFNSFLDDFSKITGAKILVHGGGNLATHFNHKLGHETKIHRGRRITSMENLEVVTMVYAGLINKNITAQLQKRSCNAMGLSGADTNCILSTKRKSSPIDYGWVGDISSINTSAIQLFISNDIIPVFCAITHDGNGQLLNTNADTIAAEIAITLSTNYSTKLIYCFENKGVLRDINDKSSVIKHINLHDYNELKATHTIRHGMLPKMDNGFNALKHDVTEVIIGNSQVISNSNGPFTSLTL